MIGLGLMGLAIGILYRSTLVWLFGIWWNDREYSHALLVPPIAIYLGWIKRAHLESLTASGGTLLGGAVILASGILLVAGRAGGVAIAGALSLLLLLPGIVLFVWGWDHLKALALPLVYLQFMVPWMEEFVNRIHWPFQILSANVGVWLMQAFGLAVYQDEKLIYLPNVTLEVAQACSGVRFLTSVVALGIPLVYLTQRTWFKGAGVIIAGVIITILANGLRVALAGFMGNYYGAELIHGPSHIFHGWFIAQVGFIALFVINWAVCKLPSRSDTRLHERWKAIKHGRVICAEKTSFSRSVTIVLLLLFGFWAYIQWFGAPRPQSPKRPLAEFPTTIGIWEGNRSPWLKSESFFPGADSEINRTYKSPLGKEVHLYVGYYESQRHGKSLINPRANPLREGLREVPTNSGALLPRVVNRSSPRIDHTDYSAVFWYRYPSGELTGRYEAKLKGTTDAVLKRRNNGAVVLLALRDSRMEGAKATGDLLEFGRAVAPLLRDYLP